MKLQEIQAVFPAKNRWSRKQKRSSSQKRHKIWCQSTKNPDLDLDLRSRSSEPVNFFGAQFSLGRAQFSFGGAQAVSWGGTAPVCPPVAPGLRYSTVRKQCRHYGGTRGAVPP